MKTSRILGLTLLAFSFSTSFYAATPFSRGDANDDGGVDLSDSMTILLHLFAGGCVSTLLDALDVDDSGEIGVTGAVYHLDYLFRAGSEPHPPFPEPGFDPTPEDSYTEGDPAGPVGGLEPDLAVAGLSIDEDGFLNVTLANQGRAAVPEGTGTVELYVDGRLAAKHNVGDLADPSYRDPGGSASVRTAVRIGGDNRRSRSSSTPTATSKNPMSSRTP